MTFKAVKARVHNRGNPPDGFLAELIEWARTAPDEIFAPNAVPVDIFTVIKSSLGTCIAHDNSGTLLCQWDSLLQRKAAMLEAMRVHAGFESSWTWILGVDTTNKSSVEHVMREEAGIFQVSYDSIDLGHGAMKSFVLEHHIDSPLRFISAMKSDHALALTYYARLVRISIAWAGPLLRHGQDSIYPWLSRSAVAEFMAFLQCPNPTS